MQCRAKSSIGGVQVWRQCRVPGSGPQITNAQTTFAGERLFNGEANQIHKLGTVALKLGLTDARNIKEFV
jgi:hypothetical protein